jgi:hypothetical protein
MKKHEAGKMEGVIITRYGRQAGVLTEFASDEDSIEYRLEHHREFLGRVADARAAIHQGQGVEFEELD